MTAVLTRTAGAVALLTAGALHAQSAPPLTGVAIVAVSSMTQSEQVRAGQARTVRPHTGPITIVVREVGIGRARLLRIDGAVASSPSTQRPLCGAAVTAGACRSGEATTGVEITYHLGPLPRGTIVAFQDTSATLPAQTLGAEITIG